MKVGVNVAVNSNTGDVGAFAKKAEDLGFQSLWMAEHPIMPVHTTSKYGGTPDGSIPPAMSDMADPFISLAIASGTTSKIKLGTSICLIPEHNPLVQAKQIAALDYHSGGRFIFGIGTGWLREETEIMGGDFDHRWTQAKEAIEAMKEMWTKDEAEYHGHYFDFPKVRVFPKPAQKPYPPVFLGGAAANVFKRVVNYGDGWMPYFYDVTRYANSVEKIKRLAAEAGRDMTNFQWAHFPYISIYPTKQQAAEVAAEQLGGRYLYGGEFLDIVRKYCLLGTVENCIEQLQGYINAGARYIVFSISCPREDRARHLELIAKELIPHFQSS